MTTKTPKLVPPPPRSPCRVALAEAIAARDAAVEAEKEKLAELATGAENLKVVDARYKAAEAAVAATKEAAADRMVAAARGGIVPAPDQALVQARIEAVAAKDECEAASRAYLLIKDEMDAATAEREACDAAVEAAADRVIVEEGGEIMADLIARGAEIERGLVAIRHATRWLLARRIDTYHQHLRVEEAPAVDRAAWDYLKGRRELPGAPQMKLLAADEEAIDWAHHALGEVWSAWRTKLATHADALPPVPADDG